MNYDYIFRNITTAILTFALLITVKLHAQSGDSSFLVGEVIVQGTSVSADVVKLSSGLSEGKTIYGEDIQSAIKKLWKLNLFSDISIEGKERSDGKMVLILKLEDLPRLNNVKISGFNKFDKDDIETSHKPEKRSDYQKEHDLNEVERGD